MEPDAETAPELAKSPGPAVRALMRRAGQAALASALARDGSRRPYASLALSAVDHDASPVLLISDLADHTRNLKGDPRAALLYDGTAGLEDPLTGPRASVLGTLRPVEDADEAARLAARYVARHPGAATYVGFADFRLYRMAVESVHLVAGFGRIHWLRAEEVLFDAGPCAELAAAEPDIVAHMNADHAEALGLIAGQILGLPADGRAWTMTGIDPEGFDLRRGAELARADFGGPVTDPEEARAALVELTREARRRAGRAAG
jgi:putative heme iron utilization protein